mgnify:CR=1 FL=1
MIKNSIVLRDRRSNYFQRHLFLSICEDSNLKPSRFHRDALSLPTGKQAIELQTEKTEWVKIE